MGRGVPWLLLLGACTAIALTLDWESPAVSFFPGAAGAAFAPTHRVPVEGLPAWQVPDGSTQAVGLNGGLELQQVQRVGDWAQVRATNGWTGWVDARRLLPR